MRTGDTGWQPEETEMYIGSGKKMLNICILDILRRYTDSEHTMDQKDIIAKLKEDYDVTVDRKSVKANLTCLVDYGYDIGFDETVRKRADGSEEILMSNWHYNHEFTDAELIMMSDSILFSKAIPEGQARQLIDKISGLSNIYFKNSMKHVSSLPGLEHTSNKQTLLAVELIDEAITGGKQISFVYNDYGEDAGLHPRREEPYIVNPYQLVANDGRFYLVCNYDKYDNLSNYRVDKMTQVKMLDTPVKPPQKVAGMENGLNLPKHMAEHIYMFADEPQTIVLRVNRSAVSDVVDWFGKGFMVIDESIARTYDGFRETDGDVVYMRLSCAPKAMLHWAMQYGPVVEVIYPDELRKEIGQTIKRMNDMYNG